jgi:D-cysteine desulfhydrase
LGYAGCAAEIVAQERELGLRFGRIVVPNGSSGTQAGLTAGLKGLGDAPSRVHAFTVLAALDQACAATKQLAGETLALLDPGAAIDEDDIVITGDQLGRGYGEPTEAMIEAVRLLARTEGLLLDPVYSGKAFAGLIAAIRSGAWAGEAAVLFIMTGGLPGLFAYEPAFRPS